MSEVNARILLWGLEGAGKRTTLQTIHARLREDLRGDLRSEPTRLDPTVHYSCLPIRLGEIGGVGTRLELIAVPGAPDQAMTRKQLLDEVDGLGLVLDCSPERFEAIEELRVSLAAYGRTLESFPIVLQYNKRDVADPFAIEDLHRRIGLADAAVFETIAPTGHGIMHTLTTISKHVVRARRGASGEIDPQTAREAAEGVDATSEPIAPPPELETELAVDVDAELEELEEIEEIEEIEPLSTADLLESAILAEGEAAEATRGSTRAAFEDEASALWGADALRAPEKTSPGLGRSLRIVSVGQASLAADGGVRLPLVLGDEDGTSRSVLLSLRLDALVGAEPGDDD